jgi:hypothetical protein
MKTQPKTEEFHISVTLVFAALSIFFINTFIAAFGLFGILWGQVSNFVRRDDMQTFQTCVSASIITAIVTNIITSKLGIWLINHLTEVKGNSAVESFIVSTAGFIVSGSIINLTAIYLIFFLTDYFKTNF